MGDTTDRPTIHLTNWSSRSLHGPGWKYTIMAAPRRWEHGEGLVRAVAPNTLDLADFKAGRLTLEDYRTRFLVRMERFSEEPSVLAPGMLTAERNPGAFSVRDGDTLCCACSRADAAAGKCHRAWAAPYLVRAGWRVILDGVEVPHV